MNNVDKQYLEEFRAIPDYEGLYEASSMGVIRSLPKNGCPLGGILKPYTTWDGYLRVNLSKNNQGKKFFVHRLIAITFIPNPDNLPQINHKNTIKTDNYIDNLEWCTNRQNQLHGFQMGVITYKQLEKAREKQMRPLRQYDKTGKLIGYFRSIAEAGKAVNRTPEAIRCMLIGKSNFCAGFKWEYADE